MGQDLIDKIKNLQKKFIGLKKTVDFKQLEDQLKSLENQMSRPKFWNNQQKASVISKEASDVKEEIDNWQNLTNQLDDLVQLSETNDDELSKEIANQFYKLSKEIETLEGKKLLSGQHDTSSAILSIYAGAGGVDAQDWAEMLLRMYLRFCEIQGWQTIIINESRGGEAGIKSVSVEVNGRLAYGYLKAEAGVHRLVRLSPFDADHARHTSFAMVEVVPELEEIETKINPDDLRIDVYRASGHGGQSVNTTDSAVRITHLPTGITVTCQNERSQYQNKATALKYLYGKLVKYNEAQQEEERKIIKGEFTEAAWGNQIRSYVLHPYQMVKDHRTNFEVKDPQKVLDGNLIGFMEEFLKKP